MAEALERGQLVQLGTHGLQQPLSVIVRRLNACLIFSPCAMQAQITVHPAGVAAIHREKNRSLDHMWKTEADTR